MKNDTITAPAGFSAGSAACGIKASGKLDLGIVAADTTCTAAAVFTTNRFCGAPVTVGREHIKDGKLRAFVVNSGCSNVATGQRGIADARRMCQCVANELKTPVSEVFPSSTGKISEFLTMKKVESGIAAALATLSPSATAGQEFALAIMTTDTKIKQACAHLHIGQSHITIAGCCKGSGMIAPNMATMLAFLTSDAGISPIQLNRLLSEAVEPTFNRITVDECPSTSDTVAMMASGAAGQLGTTTQLKTFAAALREVCESLAYQVVADGEGATRVFEVNVSKAKSAADAHAAARAVAVSALVKTAIHGADPNWGRIVQALGATKVAFRPERVTISLEGITLFTGGAPVPNLNNQRLSKMMKKPHLKIEIDLAAGRYNDRVLSCDLSRDYVAINADYST